MRRGYNLVGCCCWRSQPFLDVRFQERQFAYEPTLSGRPSHGRARPHTPRVLRTQRRHVLHQVVLCKRRQAVNVFFSTKAATSSCGKSGTRSVQPCLHSSAAWSRTTDRLRAAHAKGLSIATDRISCTSCGPKINKNQTWDCALDKPTIDSNRQLGPSYWPVSLLTL